MLDVRVWGHSAILKPSIFRDNAVLSNLSTVSEFELLHQEWIAMIEQEVDSVSHVSMRS